MTKTEEIMRLATDYRVALGLERRLASAEALKSAIEELVAANEALYTAGQEQERENMQLKNLNLKFAISVVALAHEAWTLTREDEIRDAMKKYEPLLETIFTEEPSLVDDVLSVLKETQ